MKSQKFQLLTLIFVTLSFGTLIGQSITLSPDNADPSDELTVTISGTGTTFSVASTTTAQISNGTTDYTITGTTSNSTTFAGTLTVPADATPGDYDASIWQEGNTGTFWSCSNCFTINGACTIEVTGVGTDVDCNGESTGAIDVTVTGATAPTFSWSNGSTTEDLAGLPAGSYTLIATEGDCADTITIVITEPDVLNLAIDGTDEQNGGDGSAVSTVSGGTEGYTYSWSNGATTASVSELVAGTYSLTITDANGCQASGDVVIDAPSEALSLTTTADSALCAGDANGSASVQITGGVAPYLINWSNGGNTDTINDLPAGTYLVTVTDNDGSMATDSVLIGQPDSLSLLITTTNAGPDSAAIGTAVSSITGGTAPYMISWSNGDTGLLADSLAPGDHMITVIDANNCQLSRTFSISASACNISASLVATQPLCVGDSGRIVLSYMGFAEPVAINWSDGSSDTIIDPAAIGSYSVTIADANGCSLSDTIAITSPDTIRIAVDSTSQDTLGSIYISVTGGSGVYTYVWSDTSGEVSSMEDLLDRPFGKYSLVVTDDLGCTALDTFELSGMNTSTYDLILDQSTQLYPSRTNSWINIDLPNGNRTFQITLYSSNGQILSNESVNSSRVRKDLSALSQGLYFIRIAENGTFATKKLIKY